MSNLDFAQYKAKRPEAGASFVMRLSTAWTETKPDELVWHQTIVRTLKRKDRPQSIKVDAQHFAYETVLTMGMTGRELAATFDEMAADRKETKKKANAFDKLINELAGLVE